MSNRQRFLTRKSHGVCVKPATDGCDTEAYTVTGYPDMGGEAWKLDLGEQCNALLDHAYWLDTCSLNENDSPGIHSLPDALRSVVLHMDQMEDFELEP